MCGKKGSRFGPHGPQPVFDVVSKLYRDGTWSVGYVHKVSTGWGVPNPKFILEACELTGRRPTELFTEEVLRLAYQPRTGRRGWKR